MKKILGLLFISAFTYFGCSRDHFAEINTDPDLVFADHMDPVKVFPNAVLAIHTNDFEAYYDINRNITFWNYQWVRLAGSSASIQAFRAPVTASQYPYRYDNLYSRETMGAGGAVAAIQHIIDEMPEADRAKYAHVRAIALVPKAYAAFNLSDVLGSIPYSEAFKARYTNPPLLTPKYDTQEELFAILDKELKESVAILKVAPAVAQTKLANADLYYHGGGDESINWAQAANALRLKIAMRILKRKPDEAKRIINEVLTDNIGPINSQAASWVFRAGKNIANGGNWGTFGSLSGNKATVDFQYENQDPRLRNQYRKSLVTATQFAQLKANGTLPQTEEFREYRGRYVSLDAALDPEKRFYFNQLPGVNVMYSSEIQTALFNSAINQGLVNFPVITYADVCFMRAELAARGITQENAEDWYKKGITASIKDYNSWGQDANVQGFTPVTDAETNAYLAKDAIKYDPAKGVEQICVQQYINFFKNPNEAWALIKRTGYPSTSGVVIKAEKMLNAGIEVKMPRRWSIVLPPISDFNYQNAAKAIADMQKDPSFGELSDITGRVWWDQP